MLDEEDRDERIQEFPRPSINSIAAECSYDVSHLRLLTAKEINIFLTGNIDFSKLDITSDNPEDSYLLVERNKVWLNKIINLHNQGGAFVAVGYSHLDYDIGVLSLLKNQGSKIFPIQITNH